MFEIKVHITAPELVEALKALTLAMVPTLVTIVDEEPEEVVVPVSTTLSTPAPVPEIISVPIPETVPLAAAPSFNLDEIMVAGASLVDAGKMDELVKLLAEFGVQAVTQLQAEQLGSFATALRALGASI